MGLLPSHYPDARRRKSSRKKSSWGFGARMVLFLGLASLCYLGWSRGTQAIGYLPTLDNPGGARRDLKADTRDLDTSLNGGDGNYAVPASGLTTFPATSKARRLLVATHSRLCWYEYDTGKLTIIHEGEGVYYGGFPGNEVDREGSPSTVWVVSRPHNWHPTTSKEWLYQLNVVTGELMRKVPLASRFTHDTVRYGDKIYVADTGEGHILQLKFPSMMLEHRWELFTLKEHVNTLSPTGNGTMWAMLHNLGPSVLVEIDLATGKEVRRLSNVGLKSHGAVLWRGVMISLDSDNGALMQVDLSSGTTHRLWKAPDAKRYLKGLCVVDDIAFFGIAEAQERKSRDSTDLNCEIGAFDLIEGVLLWRRQIQTRGLLNVLAAPHLQVESTAHAVWTNDRKQSYRATEEYAEDLALAQAAKKTGKVGGRRRVNDPLIDDPDPNPRVKNTTIKLSLLDTEGLPVGDPLVAYPPAIGGHWATGYPRLDNASKDKSHGLGSGAQLPLLRFDQKALKEYLLSLPMEDWGEEAARKSNAWLTGREGNLNQFKPGTSAIHMIFSDNKGDTVFEFPWYKERFAKFVDPLLEQLLGDDVANIIRMQFAIMPAETHIKRHIDRGGYSAIGHRIHLVVASSPKVKFMVCEKETCVPIHVEEGLVFELNNRLDHYVDNDGDAARIHMVVDVVESPRKRIALKVGQVCAYNNGRIDC